RAWPRRLALDPGHAGCRRKREWRVLRRQHGSRDLSRRSAAGSRTAVQWFGRVPLIVDARRRKERFPLPALPPAQARTRGDRRARFATHPPRPCLAVPDRRQARMNDRSPPRRPATFRLDDPGVVVTEADETSRLGRATIQITPEPDPMALPVPIEPALSARRGFPWGALFWSGVGGLTLLGTGLGVVNLIEDLFARSESLGFVGLALAFTTT